MCEDINELFLLLTDHPVIFKEGMMYEEDIFANQDDDIMIPMEDPLENVESSESQSESSPDEMMLETEQIQQEENPFVIKIPRQTRNIKRGKNLPSGLKDLLNKWIIENAAFPYLSDEAKEKLSIRFGVTGKQLRTYMTNARRRLLHLNTNKFHKEVISYNRKVLKLNSKKKPCDKDVSRLNQEAQKLRQFNLNQQQDSDLPTVNRPVPNHLVARLILPAKYSIQE